MGMWRQLPQSWLLKRNFPRIILCGITFVRGHKNGNVRKVINTETKHRKKGIWCMDQTEPSRKKYECLSNSSADFFPLR